MASRVSHFDFAPAGRCAQCETLGSGFAAFDFAPFRRSAQAAWHNIGFFALLSSILENAMEVQRARTRENIKSAKESKAPKSMAYLWWLGFIPFRKNHHSPQASHITTKGNTGKA